MVMEAMRVRTTAGTSSPSTTATASSVISNTRRFCASVSGKSPSAPMAGTVSWRSVVMRSRKRSKTIEAWHRMSLLNSAVTTPYTSLVVSTNREMHSMYSVWWFVQVLSSSRS